MNIEKIRTYIGFAQKSRTLFYGVDNVSGGKSKFIGYSESLGDASKDKCKNISNRYCIPVKEFSVVEMDMLFKNDKIKVFSVANQELANAIINNL